MIDSQFEDELGQHHAGELLLYPPGSHHAWKSAQGATLYVTWTGETPRV